jgi:PAS domain S-box-containing protein
MTGHNVMGSESLDRIVGSDEAVFAIDRTDRIIVWNGACERLLGHSASLVLGRFCFDVMGGRDLFGNVHCYENCPVVHQIRSVPEEPIHRFVMRVRAASGEAKTLSVSAFLLDAGDARLGAIVHVLKSEGSDLSSLEHHLHRLSLTTAPAGGRNLRLMSGQAEELTAREREILQCVARGLSTDDVAAELCIAVVTVRNHVRNVLQKLGVHTKLAAVAYAYQNQIL